MTDITEIVPDIATAGGPFPPPFLYQLPAQRRLEAEPRFADQAESFRQADQAEVGPAPVEAVFIQPGSWCVHQPTQVGSGWVSKW